MSDEKDILDEAKLILQLLDDLDLKGALSIHHTNLGQLIQIIKKLIQEIEKLRSDKQYIENFDLLSENNIKREQIESLTKERNRFKRIAENLLSDYNWIQYNEYSNEPIKLEDFEEPIDREADSI